MVNIQINLLIYAVRRGFFWAATEKSGCAEIGKREKGNVRGIFSTMLYIHIFLALIVLIVGETLGLWFLNNYMNFPPDRYNAANWVFQFSLLTFMINVINVPYNGALIAYEKMSAFAYFSIIDAIFKLVICYIIVVTPFDRLIMYAILMAFIQITLILAYYLYCRRKFPQCRFDGKFNRQYGKQVTSFVSWNLIGSFAGIGKEQGVNVVLNMFFGPSVNAARGVAYQVLTKLNGFVTNFQMAMNPQIIKNYASGEMKQMYNLVFRGAKLSYMLLLTLSLPIIIEASLILNIWLKEVPDYTVIFLRLIIFTALLNTLSNPLIISMHASGKVRDYQIVVGGLSLLTLPIVYIAFKFNVEPYYAMLIALVIEFVCHIARLYMLVRSINFPMRNYLKDVTLRVILITILSLILPCIAHHYIPIITVRFISVCFLSVLSTVFFGYYGVLNKKEKMMIREKINKIYYEKIKKIRQ